MHFQTKFVFKQGAIYGVGNVVSKLSGVILIPLYLRYINESEFGVVTLFETIFQFVLMLSGLGVKGGFTRWYHEMANREQKQKLFFTTWSFNALTSFLSVVLVGLLLLFFSSAIFKYEISYDLIVYFLIGTMFRLMYDVPFYLLKLEQRAASQTWWLVLNIALMLGFTFYFLEYRKMGLKGIYLAQMVAHVLTFLAMIPLIINNLKIGFLHGVLKQLLNYGFPLAVSNVLTTVLTLSDRHIINQYQNLDEVAGYSMAFKVANLVQMIVVASLVTSYSNYFFKTMHARDSMQFFARFTRLFVILLTFGGLGIVLFSPEIIYVISSGSSFFQGSVVLIPVLMAGLIFSGLRQLLTLPLNMHKKTKRISLILVLSAVVNILGNFILVPEYGKMGASVSTVAAQLFGLIWIIIEVKKYERVSLKLVKSFWLLVFWGVMVVVGMQTFAFDLPLGWLLKLLVVLVFTAFMFLMGLITREDTRIAWRFFKP